jgi:hypothetical protein
MSMARIFVIRLKETPKFLVGEGKDAEAVEILQGIATKYNRPCSLTLESLQACGTLTTRASLGKSKWGFGTIGVHLKGLYATKRIGVSTSLIWLSWTLIGLAYPLYNVFLPEYLKSRGAAFGEPSPYITWRNYTLVNFSGIWGPVLAGYMCHTRLGRKYTMVTGALVTMAFFFAYTQVRTAVQNVVFACVINFCLNIYYGMYSYFHRSFFYRSLFPSLPLSFALSFAPSFLRSLSSFAPSSFFTFHFVHFILSPSSWYAIQTQA